MISIVVLSQKGGVGKTTVALNLAVALAEKKERTLLVDLDPQGGVGQSLARSDGALVGLADVWSGRATVEEAITQTKLPELSLFARGKLDAIDVVAYEQAVSAGALRDILKTLSRFDRIIFDTPSGLGGVTRAALAVADFALIPVQAEPLAMRGVGQALRVIEHVRATENPGLALLGCVQTMTDRRSEASVTVMNEMWSGFAGVLETVIPRHESFARASLEGVPVEFLGGTPTPEGRRFGLLAEEIDGLIMATKGDTHAVNERRSLL